MFKRFNDIQIVFSVSNLNLSAVFSIDFRPDKIVELLKMSLALGV